MAIDEKTRFELRRWFATQMDDPDLADAVMQAMPTVDDDQLATKTDLNDLATDLRTDIAELRTDVAGLRTDVAEIRTDMVELKGDVSRLEASMQVQILSGQMTSLRWSMAMQLTTIASLGGLITYLS